jgi:DNA-binding Xre family transcriptional regulator
MQPDTLASAVAGEIRGLMAKRQLKYGDLAAFMDVDPKTITRLLRSAHAIDLTELEKIGMFLRVDPVTLVAMATT